MVGPFSSLATRHCFTVSIINDITSETAPEAFTVRLARSNMDDYFPEIGVGNATVTILDNDCEILLQANAVIKLAIEGTLH